jgi:carboxyl-terminal processing protease
MACSFSSLTIHAQTTQNPGFETGSSTQTGQPEAWGSNGAYVTAKDESIAYSGKSSMRLQSVEGAPYGAFSQYIDIPNSGQTGPRRFKLSAFIKRSDVTNFCGLFINLLAGNQPLAFDNMGGQQLNGTHDWQEISTTLCVEGRLDGANLGGLLVGPGTVWFDDILLTELPLPTKEVTGKYRKYVKKALSIMQKNALHRDSVQWSQVYQSAYLIAGDAQSYTDCYPAIQYAISKLADNHSFLMPATQSKSWENTSGDDGSMEFATGKMLENGIAYISMPSVSSGNGKANTLFANKLHDLLEQLDAQKPTGWIFDLRQNTGGNCWPMLAGIGPLLGDGICGYFTMPNGKKEAWFYRNGASGTGKSTATKVSRKPYVLQQSMPKVAVLTGPRTGSSGEVVTVAFRGRPNCRSFGSPTIGLSTGNENYTLRDGAQIFLASSIYADRNKTVYGGTIAPDVAVDAASDEDLFKIAIEWLTK